MTEVRNPSVLAQFPNVVVFDGILTGATVDLNLAPWVGVRSVAAFLRVDKTVHTGANRLQFRRNGNVEMRGEFGAASTGYGAAVRTSQICVVTDAAGIFEWNSDVANESYKIYLEAFIYA